jgi:hypothetical protein
MNCPKCNGLLMTERSYNLHDGGFLVLTRCVNCGTYTDPTIEMNQRATGSIWPRFSAPDRREITRQLQEVSTCV